MGRILAIDYGLRRTGLAVTDPLQIIASPLQTVHTDELMSWLKGYVEHENVEVIVVGLPKNLNQSSTNSTGTVIEFIKKLKNTFPQISIEQEDERFTSKMAQQTMIAGGMKKKDRRDKANVDKISAAIILQSYLERKSNR
jgi:putative Holliday junction resolvase